MDGPDSDSRATLARAERSLSRDLGSRASERADGPPYTLHSTCAASRGAYHDWTDTNDDDRDDVAWHSPRSMNGPRRLCAKAAWLTTTLVI